MTPEQLRAEQLREGQRLARSDDDAAEPAVRVRLTTSNRYREDVGSRSVGPHASRTPRPKPKAAPSGHQAFLKALQDSGAEIAVYMRDDDDILIGKIRASDAFTISLDVKGDTYVVFKHSIQRFKPLPRPRTTPTVQEALAA